MDALVRNVLPACWSVVTVVCILGQDIGHQEEQEFNERQPANKTWLRQHVVEG